jgi:hypothetical protein
MALLPSALSASAIVRYVIGESFGKFYLIYDLGVASAPKGELGSDNHLDDQFLEALRNARPLGSRQKRKR